MLFKTIIGLSVILQSTRQYKLAILYVLINGHILKAIDVAIEQNRSSKYLNTTTNNTSIITIVM